ncbi:MAG: N-acyl homoserine lactonase family protein [Clostridiales Family XIII bacterium]|nr:N-acyl homoserine lactonase family protein [Clostridiales Family XIII bacterium]
MERVDSMRVYVMGNGMNVGSAKSDLYAVAAPGETICFPSWTVLIRHPEADILFDAAAHKLPDRQLPFVLKHLKMREEDTPPARLRQIGLTPEDIDIVYLTHMHCDHIGYLDAFPNARILVSETEFTSNMRDYGLGQMQAHKDMEYYIGRRLNWELVPDDFQTRELLPGLTMYNFGRGHAYGLLGLMIDLPKSGRKLLVGDAIYSAESMGPPRNPPGGFCVDREGWDRTVDYILDVAGQTGAEIWYGHDLAQFSGLVKSPEGYYE